MFPCTLLGFLPLSDEESIGGAYIKMNLLLEILNKHALFLIILQQFTVQYFIASVTIPPCGNFNKFGVFLSIPVNSD